MYHRHLTQSLPRPLQIQSPPMLYSCPYRRTPCATSHAHTTAHNRHFNSRFSLGRANATPSRCKRRHAAEPRSRQANSTRPSLSVQISIIGSWCPLAGNMTGRSPTSSPDGPSSATMPTGSGGSGGRGYPCWRLISFLSWAATDVTGPADHVATSTAVANPTAVGQSEHVSA